MYYSGKRPGKSLHCSGPMYYSGNITTASHLCSVLQWPDVGDHHSRVQLALLDHLKQGVPVALHRQSESGKLGLSACDERLGPSGGFFYECHYTV